MSDAGGGDSRKRKAPAHDANPRGKQMRGGKQSSGGGKGGGKAHNPPWKNTQIMPGDSGIWVTCEKGREGRCVTEVRDLFQGYAEELYAEELAAEGAGGKGAKGDDDVEMEEVEEIDLEESIRMEVEGIKRPKGKPLFQEVRLDVQCVLFFRTRPPIEPVFFVRHICRDALNNPNRKRTRYAKRLSPMTLMGKATVEGLEDVARKVLAPHFYKEYVDGRKFAIRPTMRNHNLLKRDAIIQKVASIVGHRHRVDLKNYDDLIVVEAYTSVIGMSVVPSDFEELKRYNLAEIYDPTPKEQHQQHQPQKQQPKKSAVAIAKEKTDVPANEGEKEVKTAAEAAADDTTEGSKSSTTEGSKSHSTTEEATKSATTEAPQPTIEVRATTTSDLETEEMYPEMM